MRLTRLFTLSAAVLAGLTLLTAPPASASTDVTVDCASATATDFTVSTGEQLLFAMGSDECRTILTGIGVTTDTFALFAETISVVTGTGGSIVADPAQFTVLYTAGLSPGTDSIDLSRWLLRSRVGYRIPAELPSYFMTVTPGPGPAPWLQAIGRPDKDAPCPSGWGPSWAEWPNNGTGGFVCVREYYYDQSTGTWAYR